MRPLSSAATEVARTLEALGAAWRERRHDALARFLADDIVFALPGLGKRLEGAAAAVASYREFMGRATLTDYEESAQAIDVWGDTAVASFRWDMAWISGGESHRESGHDVFVFRRATGDGTWQAVWRTMISAPPAASTT